MTYDEANVRLALSRNKLEHCRHINKTGQEPVDEFSLFEAEMGALQQVADCFPGKVNEILYLVEGWVTFRNSLRSRMNQDRVNESFAPHSKDIVETGDSP